MDGHARLGTRTHYRGGRPRGARVCPAPWTLLGQCRVGEGVMVEAQDARSAAHRQLIHDKLGAAFAAEMAARREGATARVPRLPREIAADCSAIMSSNS